MKKKEGIDVGKRSRQRMTGLTATQRVKRRAKREKKARELAKKIKEAQIEMMFAHLKEKTKVKEEWSRYIP